MSAELERFYSIPTELAACQGTPSGPSTLLPAARRKPADLGGILQGTRCLAHFTSTRSRHNLACA